MLKVRNNVQQRLRQMQDSWLSNKADEIEGFADRNDMKTFYDGLKEVYGSTTSDVSPLLSADGSTLITDKEKILDRWAKYFDSVLNCPPTINDEAFDQVPQAPIDERLRKATRLLSSSKASDSGDIPAEDCKEGGVALVRSFINFSGSYGITRQAHWISKMLPLCFFTNAKEVVRPVTT